MRSCSHCHKPLREMARADARFHDDACSSAFRRRQREWRDNALRRGRRWVEPYRRRDPLTGVYRFVGGYVI